jgi:membrane protein required for colicin V production
MNPVDLVIGILLIYATIRGFIKGVIKELAGIVGIILGIWASVVFSGFTADFLHTQFGVEGALIKPSAFIITFIISLILVKIIANLVDKLLSTIGLSIIVKLSGAVIGILKMMLIIGTFLIILININEKLEESFFDTAEVKKSILAESTIDLTQILIPQDVFEINFKKEAQQ